MIGPTAITPIKTVISAIVWSCSSECPFIRNSNTRIRRFSSDRILSDSHLKLFVLKIFLFQHLINLHPDINRSNSTIILLCSLNENRCPFTVNLGAIKIRIFPIRFVPVLLLTTIV